MRLLKHIVSHPVSWRTVLLLFLVSGSHLIGHLQAQDPTGDPLSVRLAYAGNNLWNPGLLVGADYLFSANREAGESFSNHSWYGSVYVGFYGDPGSHFAAYGAAGITWQPGTKNAAGPILSFHPLGVYRSFLPRTYEFLDGAYPRVALAGNSYFAPSAGIGLRKQTERSREFYTRISVMVLMPYNTYIMPILNVEAGLRFGKERRAMQ